MFDIVLIISVACLAVSQLLILAAMAKHKKLIGQAVDVIGSVIALQGHIIAELPKKKPAVKKEAQ
jgi:hypothetical protein